MAVIPQIIPLNSVPSQVLDVTLGKQACRIKVFTKHIQVPVHDPGEIVTDPPRYEAIDPLFLDLYVNDVLILGGAPCLNGVAVVRDSYLGFAGELSFTDTHGEGGDPTIDQLGSRYLFLYWPAA